MRFGLRYRNSRRDARFEHMAITEIHTYMVTHGLSRYRNKLTHTNANNIAWTCRRIVLRLFAQLSFSLFLSITVCLKWYGYNVYMWLRLEGSTRGWGMSHDKLVSLVLAAYILFIFIAKIYLRVFFLRTKSSVCKRFIFFHRTCFSARNCGISGVLYSARYFMLNCEHTYPERYR